MSEHLIRAAKARHDDATRRAAAALQWMAKEGEAITFAAVARRAGVSTDFLYNTATLRSKITDLRATRPPTTDSAQPQADGGCSTSAIRVLSARLKEARRQHRAEIETLHDALAAATHHRTGDPGGPARPAAIPAGQRRLR